MLAVQVRDLAKSYPRSSFKLNIADLKIESGSIMGLLGPNGSGKTTLLKLLMDISHPDHGEITLLGHDVREHRELLPLVSYMPENKNLYNHLSLEQNLKLASGMLPGFNSRTAELLLKRFDLNPKKKYKNLSYGEKTQLYAIITFARPAELYVLDEPTRGLDPGAQDEMLSLIRESSVQEKTVIFSSHQLDEIEESADTVIFIRDGEIILNGNLDDIKASHFLLELEPSQQEVLRLNGVTVLSRDESGGRTVLFCQGDDAARERLVCDLPSLELAEVNLKDLYLYTMRQGRDSL